MFDDISLCNVRYPIEIHSVCILCSFAAKLGVLACFKEIGIQKDRCPHKHGLVLHRSSGGKLDLKGIGIRQEFRCDRLGSLDNFAYMRGFRPVGIRCVGIKDPKGHDTTTTATTGIALSAAVHAKSTGTTGWWMDFINGLARRVLNVKHGDTKVTGFPNRSKLVGVAGEGGTLIATTFARSHTAAAWSVDAQQLRISIHFLDAHGKRVNRAVEKSN